MKKKVSTVLFCVVLFVMLGMALSSCSTVQYLVTYDCQGGDAIDSEYVLPVKTPKLPTPTRAGYTFTGWYFNADIVEGVSKTYPPKQSPIADITLYAGWKMNHYNLTLKKNIEAAGTIEEVGGTYDYNSVVTLTAVTNMGYHFLGWIDNTQDPRLIVSFEETYSFTVNDNCEITATWEIQGDFKDFRFKSTPTEVTITGYTGTSPHVVVPDGVQHIGKEAFYEFGEYKVTNITLPEGLLTIGARAFGGTKIEYMTIPKSVTSIGAYAFAVCKKLVSVNIPEGIETIEKGTFSWCSKLTSIIIPKSVTTIKTCAFEWASSLDIIIPKTVTTVESDTFYMSSSIIIKCEAVEKPDGWENGWRGQLGGSVVWGYSAP